MRSNFTWDKVFSRRSFIYDNRSPSFIATSLYSGDFCPNISPLVVAGDSSANPGATVVFLDDDYCLLQLASFMGVGFILRYVSDLVHRLPFCGKGPR